MMCYAKFIGIRYGLLHFPFTRRRTMNVNASVMFDISSCIFVVYSICCVYPTFYPNTKRLQDTDIENKTKTCECARKIKDFYN